MVTELLLSPAQLFSQKIYGMPSAWIKICNFLESREASLQHRTSSCVILKLAHGFCTKAADCIVSIDKANIIVTASCCIRLDLSQVETSQI